MKLKFVFQNSTDSNILRHKRVTRGKRRDEITTVATIALSAVKPHEGKLMAYYSSCSNMQLFTRVYTW